jgi:hypothetical protein
MVDRAMIGDAFPNRETNTQRDVDGYNFYSEKSIALTQRVKYLGLHSHYHCHAELPLELKDFNNGGNWKSLSGMMRCLSSMMRCVWYDEVFVR